MDTLAIWMFNTDAQVRDIGFGKAPRRSSGDVLFRVKNRSASYVATDVIVTLVGTYAWHYYLSLDGEQFGAAVELGDLAPGDYSSGITLRRVTPSDAPLGEQSVDIVATAATWAIP